MPQFDTAHFPSEIAWTLISFAALLFLCRRYVLPRIVAAIEERARMIREDLEQARAARQQAERQRREYEQRLRTIEREARRRLEEAEDRIRQQRALAMREWQAEMKRRERDFHEDLSLAKQQALREIRQHTADLVAEATERLLRREVNEEELAATVEEMLRDLRADEQRPTLH
ncbi:MAG: ATP synthase F0 subunit B [Zetaproteobacteria bacterium]|nr:MAG: ATP synthase F0 subunit B [Zetaproteobacteria bacterium]